MSCRRPASPASCGRARCVRQSVRVHLGAYYVLQRPARLPRRSKWLAGLASIWVRAVDPLVGEAVAMRVDVELADGTSAAGVYVHKLLSQSVGCAAGPRALPC